MKLSFPKSINNERFVKVRAELKTWTIVEDVIEYDTYTGQFIIPNGYQIGTEVISWEYYKDQES
jgi:hypothetical protein